MNTLCITVRFLDNRFHGQGDDGPEWPPSPFRLFQAMVSAAALHGNAADDTFRWMEQLAPPEILAPNPQQLGTRMMYVPNNDSDQKLDRQDRLAEKIVRPLAIFTNDPVCYLWRIPEADNPIAMKAASLARRISSLGWGIDLVAADGEVISSEDTDWLIQQYKGQRWLPTTRSGHRLRCPTSGSLVDLREAYQSFTARFESNVYRKARKPSIFIETPYGRIGSVHRPIAAFQLLHPDVETEDWKPFDARKTMEIAAWVRGFLCKVARNGNFPGVSEVYVAGHVPESEKNGKTPERFSFLPVPSIGHEHADGMIRRLIVAEPYGGDGRYVQWAKRVLANAVVIDKDGHPQAMLRPIVKPLQDTVISQYIREAKTVQTVTPVILPGYDDRKYSKAKKLTTKAIEQAGFPPGDMVETIYLQKAPFRKGGFAPSSYALPRYLEGKAAIHVQLTLKNPIAGPFAIGAGRHLGLGLFAAAAT